MPPKKNFYAVRAGRTPGIYTTWAECNAQVAGFSNASFKGFVTRTEAESWLQQNNTPEAPRSKKRSRESLEESDAALETSEPPAKRAKLHEPEQVEIYTDGACNGDIDARRAGVGVFFGDNDPRNVCERMPGQQTNQRAELWAVIRALEIVSVDTPILIKTDSKYTIGCAVEWIKKWKVNGWKRAGTQRDIKNKDLIVRLSQLCDARVATTVFRHVRAHSGIYGNERADELALIGSGKPLPATTVNQSNLL